MSSHAELSSEIENAIAKPLGLFGRFLFLDPKGALAKSFRLRYLSTLAALAFAPMESGKGRPGCHLSTGGT